MRRSAALVAIAAALACSGLLFAPDPGFVGEDAALAAADAATNAGGPIAAADLAVDAAIAPAVAAWFRLRSLAWHVLGAILVLVLLREWGAGDAAAAIGAVFYAVHPVAADAVGRVAARGDLIAFAGLVGALILHRRSRGFDLAFAGAVGCFVGAALADVAAVVFPLVAGLADLLFADGPRLDAVRRRAPRYAVLLAIATALIAFGPPVGRLPALPALGALLVPVDLPTDPAIGAGLPLLLALLAVASVAGAILARVAARGRVGRGAAVGVLSLLLLLGFVRGRNISSERALAEAAFARGGNAWAYGWRGRSRTREGVGLKRAAQAAWDRGEAAPAQETADRALAALAAAVEDLDRAMTMIRARDPEDEALVSLRLDRALAWFEHGDIPLARSEDEAVLSNCPRRLRGRALLLRALVLNGMRDPRAAARVAEEALALDDRPEARRRVAAIYDALASWYDRELQNRARLYLSLGRCAELDPDSEARAAARKAFAELTAHRRTEEARLRRRLELEPGHVPARVDLAILLADAGEFEEARRRFDDLLADERLGRDAGILFAYATRYCVALDTLEGYDEAERVYARIAALAPDYPALAEARADVAGMRAALEASLRR